MSSLKGLFDLDFPRLIVQFQATQGIIHAGGSITAHPGGGCAAIGTDIPWQFHEPVAVLTALLELGMTVRADLPIVFDAALAARTKR